MWFGIFLNVLFTLCVLILVDGKPFFSDGPRALTTLASSASASASSPSEPLTNIADLRRKQQKAEALQQEKQSANEEENDSAVFLEADGDETNEAAPSILQKKINKILTKLRLISSLSNAVSGGGGNDETVNNTGDDKDDDFTRELEEFDREFENDVLNKKDEANNTENVPTFQKVIYPHSDSASPVKLSFDINSRIVNRKPSQIVQEIEVVEDEIDDMAETMGRLSQIGVFFAELLGSVVGLVYGAAAQINNIAQGTTTTSII